MNISNQTGDVCKSCNSCRRTAKESMESFRESICRVREAIAENTVGRCGTVLYLPMVVLGIAGHAVILIIGAIHKSDCGDIQILPVYMALIGCTGMLKFLGLILHLGIAFQLSSRVDPEKRNSVAADVMSEASIFDTGMNWLYTVILFIGVGTVIPNIGIDEAVCNAFMFQTAFYPTIILFSLLMIVFLWIFIQFIVILCQTCCKKDEIEEDLQPIEV